MDTNSTESRWRPSPRAVFSRQFAALFEAAGNPTLRRVAAAVEARMRGARAAGQKGAVSVQRISDWKGGRNVPARFESLIPVLLTLIGEARKSSGPVPPALLDVQEWKRLWTAADDWDPDSEISECPYLGLTSYRRRDAELFFGRSRPTGEFTELVRRTVDADGGIVVLVGASGAGKSSLLEAGVIPELTRAGQDWEVCALTPGVDPVRALLDALARAETEPDVSAGEPEPGAASAETTRDPRGTEIDEVSAESVAAVIAGWAVGRRRLLVVDQFEELFTLCGDETRREIFLSALEHAAIRGEREPAAVVIAIRADFYARCLDVPVLADGLKHRSYLLGPMRLDELAAAITRPAELAGCKLDTGLEELVISELCGLGGRGVRRGYDPGALPLVSHVMEAVWQCRDGTRLTIEGYQRVGGVLGSVAATAEKAWGELSEFQQSVGKQVLLGLVAVGDDSRDTRRKVARAELVRQTVEAAETALDVLARTRLVTLDADSAYLTHEIVLDAWPRLRGWIDEDRVGYLERQRLQGDASDWAANGRDSSLLYRGARLTTMREHAGHGAIGPVAAEFLGAAETARRRAERRATGTRAALALLGVVALVLAGVAFAQSSTAKEQRDAAVFTAVIAEADRLETIDPSLSAQLNLVANRIRPGDPDVAARLVNTANMPLNTPLAGHTESVGDVALRADGKFAASGGYDDTVRIWDLSDRRNPHAVGPPLTGHTDFVTDVRFTPDGAVLASAAADDTVRLWDVRDPANPRFASALAIGYPPVVEFGSDGRTLATTNTDDGISYWDIADPFAPKLIGNPVAESRGKESISILAFAPDLRTVLSIELDSVRLWRVADPRVPATSSIVPAHDAVSAAFTRDGSLVAVAEQDAIRLWDVRDPAAPRVIGEPLPFTEPVMGAALEFDAAGRILAARSDQGDVTLWNVADPVSPTPYGAPLTTDAASVSAIEFGVDDRTVLTAGSDGIVRVWSLPETVLPEHADWVYAPIFDAAGRRMVAATEGAIEVWDISHSQGSRRVGRFAMRPGQSSTAAVSPDGRTVAVVDADTDSTRLLDITDPAAIRAVSELPRDRTGWGVTAEFSPDSRYLVTGGIRPMSVENPRQGDIVQIWDVADPGQPRPVGPALLTGDEYVLDLEFGTDGRSLAVLRTNQPVTIWDVSDPVSPLVSGTISAEPNASITSMVGQPGGSVLVTVGQDHALRVWDTREPSRPVLIAGPLTGHTSYVTSASFSADGRMLATAERDSVRLWDFSDPAAPVAIRHAVVRYPDSQSRVSATFFGNDDLFGVGTGAQAHHWNLDPAPAISRICDITRVALTAQVWRDHLPGLPYEPPCD